MKDDYKNWQEAQIGEIETESSRNGNSSAVAISVPYNPKHVKIYTSPSTIDNLVERFRQNKINLNPEFQRKGELWTSDAQSRFIESILLQFPLPAFYFEVENSGNWRIVDGLRRLYALKSFIVDQTLELNNLEILTEYNGRKVKFDNLSRALQRRVLETYITTYHIQQGMPKQIKYHIFQRTNYCQ